MWQNFNFNFNETKLIRILVALFVLIGLTYALITPAFEASDELWHYPMVRHLADGNPLPVQVYDPALAGPWKQEASQPPLYYYLSAAVTSWVDTSDMEQVRWLNPHVDNGVITADGNTNLAIHDPAFSYEQGSLLAIRIVRILSVLLGACTVYLTYLIGREVAPQRPEIALGAAALNAFTPMFLFISGAVNNDNLAVPLASLGLLLLIRLVTKPSAKPMRDTLVIGSVIGCAVLTKQGTIGLIPLAWGTFFIYQWRQVQQQMAADTVADADTGRFFRYLLTALGKSLLQFVLLFIPIVLIAGWWYWRNIQLYGDLLGWSAFIAVLGQRETPAPLAQLWDERWGFMLSYWGLFGGVNVPMWTWVYYLLNALAVAAVPGFLLYSWQTINTWRKSKTWRFDIVTLITRLLNFVVDHFGLVIVLLFATAVVYGLVQWATTTWSSQGRLVFTAMSAINILFVLGLVGWLPAKSGRWVVALISAFFLGMAALSPWLFIRPAYQAAVASGSSCSVANCLTDEASTFGGQLQLLGYEFAAADGQIEPGDYVDVVLEWGVNETTAQDWSVFVHLNDPVLGVPIAQRDMYLGQGLLPTSLLEAGDKVTNRYRLQIPHTAVSPAALQLTVGLYDFYTGERLPLSAEQDTIMLAELPLESRVGETPNPISVNFNNQFELVGYQLEPRRTTAAGSVNLTLYWRAMEPTAADYTFFAQIVGADTTRWAAADVGQPTSSWLVGEIQAIEMPLIIREDAPAGIYPLRVGVYLFTEENEFQNLQTVTADGRLTDDFINLTQIRID